MRIGCLNNCHYGEKSDKRHFENALAVFRTNLAGFLKLARQLFKQKQENTKTMANKDSRTNKVVAINDTIPEVSKEILVML